MPDQRRPLAPAPEPGPSTTVQVRPEDFHRVAQDFLHGQNRVQQIYDTLADQLRSLTGAAGNDDPARKFAQTYTPAAHEVFRGLLRLHPLLGAIAQGLAQSGTNHHQADANAAGADADPFTIVPTTCPAPIDPAPILGDGDTSVIATIADTITPYYPNGSIPKMHQLAGVYEHARSELADLAAELNAKLQSLTANNDSDDLHALDEFWHRVTGNREGTLLSALPRACEALARGCADYASAIEHTRQKIHDILNNAALELAGAGILIAVGSLLTDGLAAPSLTEGAGGAVTARITSQLAVVAGQLVTTLGTATALATTAETTGALTMAINNTPDPNVGQTSGSGGEEPPGQQDPLDKAYELANTPAKLEHVIDPPKHGFADLVARYGGRSQALRRIIDSLGDKNDLPASGRFEVTRNIDGEEVTVRGAVVKGVPRLGTAFIPNKFPGAGP